jgi:hypothetical protein
MSDMGGFETVRFETAERGKLTRKPDAYCSSSRRVTSQAGRSVVAVGASALNDSTGRASAAAWVILSTPVLRSLP